MQKSLLYTVQTICAELSFPQPQAVLSSQDQNVQQILALVRAAKDDLNYEFDWNFLQQRYTFDTVANQETYSWPADYERSLNGTFFDATNRWPLKVVTPTQWEIINIWNVTASPFERLRVFDGMMNFFPVPADVYTFVFDYISNYNVINGGTGVSQADFVNDSDICMFDYRLLVYLVKYKLLTIVGNDTTAAYQDYKRILELAKGTDTPAPRLSLIPQGANYISNANIPDGNWGP
jgi:hypothetical protein